MTVIYSKAICPYFTICTTPPNSPMETKNYSAIIRNIPRLKICKTILHKKCIHKLNWDDYFSSIPEGDKQAEMKRRTEGLLLKRIEEYLQNQWTDYFTRGLSQVITQHRTIKAVKTFCKDHDLEWMAQDILKMIRETESL
jgi:hypothetical protein